jgi:iron complex outermembrane recepter protein
VRDTQNIDISPTLAVRGAIDYVNHTAYQSSTIADPDGRWSANTGNARISALYTPSDLFSAYVWAFVYRDDSLDPSTNTRNLAGQWNTPGNNAWDLTNNCNTLACNGAGNPVPGQPPHLDHSTDYILAGQFDWHFDGLTLTDIPSFLRVDLHTLTAPWIFTDWNYITHSHQFTNELKLANDVGAAQWLAGLWLQQVNGNSLCDFCGSDVHDYTLKNAAPYGQLTYSFTDTLRGTLGARYNWVQKSGTWVVPNPTVPVTASWGAVDAKAGLEADLKDNVLGYATFQTGSSPGTFDDNVVDAAGVPAKTKLTRMFSGTVGVKTEWFDKRLVVNNEAWYYYYKDFLIQGAVCGTSSTCFPVVNRFLNAPSMTSIGDELSIRARVTSTTSVGASYAFTKARTGHWITNAGANLSDQTLQEAPESTLDFNLKQEFPLPNGGEFTARVDSYFSSGYYSDFGTTPGGTIHDLSQRQEAYSTSGASLTYHAPQDRWSLGAWVRNIENKGQIAPGAVFGPGAFKGGVEAINYVSGAPRTYGLQFNTRFDMNSK